MKVSELKRKLKKAGCSFIRQGANHEIWYSKTNGNLFPVPRHDGDELPTGTAESIFKEAGLK